MLNADDDDDPKGNKRILKYGRFVDWTDLSLLGTVL
jgi:hypothetical protein